MITDRIGNIIVCSYTEDIDISEKSIILDGCVMIKNRIDDNNYMDLYIFLLKR